MAAREPEDSTERHVLHAVREIQRARSFRRAAVVGRLIPVAVFLWSVWNLLAVWLARDNRENWVPGTWQPPSVQDVDGPLLWVIGSLVAMQIAWLVSNRKPVEAVAALAEVDSVRAIPSLSKQLGESDAEVRAAVEEALADLLSRVRDENAALFDRATRRRLLRELTMRRAAESPRLVFAVIRAMEHVGDTAAYQAVRRLAEETPENNEQERVRARCWKALPLLEAQAARYHETSRLLRPTRKPEEGLLRPAHGAGQDDAKALLRATNNEES
jgi:hypothetical protein